MKAKDVMTREVHTCRADHSLSEAAQIMWNHDCGTVPVVDPSGRIQGMVTDRDCCMASLTQGKPIGEIPVSAAMSRRVLSCAEEDDARQVEATMSREQLRRLPVVDSANRVVGIVSLNDLAVHALDGKDQRELVDVARTLGEICRHRTVEVA